MASTSLDKVRQRRKEAAEEAERRKAKYWKIKPGRNVVRFAPPWEGSDEFYKAFGQHYNLGPDGKQPPVYCPEQTVGKSCPICEGIRMMYRGADEETQKLLKKMSSTPRFYVNLIDRKDEEKGVQVGEIPRTLMEDIWKKMVDDEIGIGDVTDPENGYDLIIDRTGEGIGTKYTVEVARKPSKLDKKYLADIVDLEKFVKIESYENLKLIYEGKSTGPVVTSSSPAALPGPVASTSDAVDAEFTVTEPSAPGLPACFGSFSEDNAKCLDCAECDDCENAMIKAKREARKAAADTGKSATAASPPKREPASAKKGEEDISPDELLAEISAAITR